MAEEGCLAGSLSIRSLVILQLLCLLPLGDLALAPGFCFCITHASLRAVGVEPVSTTLTRTADRVPATGRSGQTGLLPAPGLRAQGRLLWNKADYPQCRSH